MSASHDNLPLRMKSQRLVDKAIKQHIEQQKIDKESQTLDKMEFIKNPTVTDLYPGLNEVTDALQAFPYELIRYFTLLKEIDAKCVNTVPYLRAYIIRFIQMKKTHPKRELLLSKIRDLIKELMPCLEEKMHVATIASDTVNKNIRRINQAYEIVVDHEIPEIIRIGPLNHPAMTVINEPKSAQSQRSESRREALAAKKAAAGLDEGGDSRSTTPMPNANNNQNSLNINGASRSYYNNGSGSTGAASNSGTGTTSATNTTTSRKQKGSTKEGSTNKKRKQTANSQEFHDETNGSPVTSGGANGVTAVTQNNANGTQPPAKKKQSKPRKDRVKKEENPSNGNGNSNGTNTNGSSSDKSHNGNSHNNNSNSKSDSHDTNGTQHNHGKGSNSGKSYASKNTVHEPSSPPSYDGEPVYCYCQQVSYGEMVGCDGDSCEKEWFHLPCTGLKELPTGEWYCDECKSKMKKK